MRDYYHIERYLNQLATQVYPQPPDPGHQKMLEYVCHEWLSLIEHGDIDSVLDVGCGQGQAIETLLKYSPKVEGVTLGSDADICREKGYKVFNADMSFLPYADGGFQLIFARHVLEHSPMPLLTLMEWWRVSRQWLLLVLPDPDHYTYSGRNHYSVMNRDQARNLLAVAGWAVIWNDDTEKTEIRLFCEKVRHNE